MKRHTHTPTEQYSESRRPYTPPQATFVPLKIEERLLGCSKHGNCKKDYDGAKNQS
jgi:hypothetical protein